MKQKKRLFNLRLFFIGFLGVVCGILAVYQLLNIVLLSKGVAWFVFFAVVFLLMCGLTIFCIAVKDKRKFLKYCLMFVLLFVIGGSVFALRFNSLTKIKSYDGEVEVKGTVSGYYESGSNFVINLKDVSINNESTSGDVVLYIVYDVDIPENLSLGDKVVATTKLSKSSLVTDEIELERYVNNKVYYGYIMASKLGIVDEKAGLVYGFQEKLKSTLEDGLTNENSSIAYSVLIGDKSELDENVSEIFSYAGISHILAVSGLHVGFLVAIITFILNVFRVGRRVRFVITTIILAMYSLLCGFTPSVLRASFMIFIMLLGGVLGKEYDGLNSLGFSGIMILLIKPLNLFSLGFQLSFMCVFMIITLADCMSRVLLSWHIPSAIASSLSISLCVTIGSSIILANSLNTVSLISIVANLIVIPLFSITYPLLFTISIFAIIMPFLTKLLFLPQILLHIVKMVANFFANVNFAHFKIYNLGYVLLLIFVVFSILAKFFMADEKIKLPINIGLVAICVILVVVGCIPTQFDTFALYTSYQYDGNSAILTTADNKKFVIGIDDNTTSTLLTKLKISTIDALIIPNFEVNKIDDYLEFVKTTKTKELVIPYSPSYVDKIFAPFEGVTNVRVMDLYSNSIDVEFVKTDSDVVCGTVVDINNRRLLFTNGITKVKLNALGDNLDGYVDYIVTNSSKYEFSDYDISYGCLIYSNTLKFSPKVSISLMDKSYYMLELE